MRRHSSACDTRPEVICVWLLGAVWWPWMAKLSHRQPDTHDTSAQVGRGAVGFSTRVQRHERAIGSTSNRRHARARAHSCGAHSRPPCVRTIAGVRLTQTPTPWAPACRPPAVWAGRHAGHGCQGSAVQRRPPPPTPPHNHTRWRPHVPTNQFRGDAGRERGVQHEMQLGAWLGADPPPLGLLCAPLIHLHAPQARMRGVG